jgi:hypothetical protein
MDAIDCILYVFCMVFGYMLITTVTVCGWLGIDVVKRLQTIQQNAVRRE